jgi:hypothetical protein
MSAVLREISIAPAQAGAIKAAIQAVRGLLQSEATMPACESERSRIALDARVRDARCERAHVLGAWMRRLRD